MTEENLVQSEPVIAPQLPTENRLLKYVFFAILGLLLGGTTYVGHWYGTEATRDTQHVTRESQNLIPTEAPVATPTPTPDPTADWETYTSQKYPVTFKYPSYYHRENEYWSYPGKDTPLGLGSRGVWFTLDNALAPNLSTSLEEFMDLPINSSISTAITSTAKVTELIYTKTLENESSMTGGSTFSVNPGPKHYQPTYGYMYVTDETKDGNRISFTMTSWKKEVLESHKPTFDQILSTFQFLD